VTSVPGAGLVPAKDAVPVDNALERVVVVPRDTTIAVLAQHDVRPFPVRTGPSSAVRAPATGPFGARRVPKPPATRMGSKLGRVSPVARIFAVFARRPPVVPLSTVV
jgi:hypothetical protein